MLVTLGEMPARAAAAFGDRPAVIFEDAPYSFEALDRRAGRFANALVAAGIEPGDRVTLSAPNSFDWMAAYYGAAKAGAVLNPVTAMLTAGEIGYIAGNCGAKLLLVGPGKGEALFEALADTAVFRTVAYRDLVDAHYGGHHYAAKRSLESLAARGLIEVAPARGRRGVRGVQYQQAVGVGEYKDR